MSTKQTEDWADRRAREFFEEHLPVDSCRSPTEISECDRDYLIQKLAADYRHLTASCEPRSALDM